ncbi:calponin y domain-containing protein [Pyrus ussuriensis x Pyrus communis]|uniref:Calponin y domain-containing protein n=1 Tax=Pyrus ussuriensis x Pyrus communis TaxID=2448454 RepID=A0A5N5HVI7_9ROSA|nr:calponin y domain-containing protein [Pyrus ussuriensis x Pyrus communis]
MEAGKLEQNIRDDVEKLFLEHKRASSKSEYDLFDLNNKLELSETQKKQFEEILVQNVLRMQELLKKHDQSKAGEH